MNEKIKGLLANMEDPMCQYAAKRIEELEKVVLVAKRMIDMFNDGRREHSGDPIVDAVDDLDGVIKTLS